MKSQHQIVYLANGKKRLVPAGAEILNSERMGEAACAYYVQTFDPIRSTPMCTHDVNRGAAAA